MEVNDEDRIRAEIYFAEQQQLLQQPQMYYSNGGLIQTNMQPTSNNNGFVGGGSNFVGVGAGAPNQIQNSLNTVNLSQLDHPQFLGMSQSPRLKPIAGFQQINNQIANQTISSSNQNNSANANNNLIGGGKKITKSPYLKK